MKTICVIDGQGGGIGSTIIRRIKDAMCESNAYLVEGDETRLLMEPVDTVAPAGGGRRLVDIFGTLKFLKARMNSLSLVDNKVYLTRNG